MHEKREDNINVLSNSNIVNSNTNKLHTNFNASTLAEQVNESFRTVNNYCNIGQYCNFLQYRIGIALLQYIAIAIYCTATLDTPRKIKL